MDKQTVLKVAHLARLKVDDTRAEVLAEDLGGILKWIAQLDEVDTKGVEPMAHSNGQKAYRRPDVVTDGNRQQDITANAPESAEGFFIVPKVVE